MQNNSLQDKVALITGGAQRLGAAIAARLHAAGMKLVIHYRSSGEAAGALQAALNEERPASVALVAGDLLDVDGCQRLVNECTECFGRLDALVNNAGAFYATPFGHATTADWETLMGTNLRAPFFLVQEAAPELQKRRGSVVNIADIYGQTPREDYMIYSTAKAGLIALTRALARELAPAVRVNAVAPGAILWPEGGEDEAVKERIIAETPLNRIGSPDEIAEAVLFLIAGSTFTTGHVLPVDGGRIS